MFLVAELEETLVGYYIGSVSGGDPRVGWVLRLWVAEHLRRRGIASDLLNQGEIAFMNDGISLIMLSCSPVNTGALTLYHNQGYHDLRYENEYFGKGEDRVILRKTLG
jgi:[ribosomal protein S18]-alanine N-acetyltransferase